MYEELAKRLRNISNSDSNIKSNYIGLTMIQAADTIEELSRAQEQWIEQERKLLLKSIPHWIPVTERLPEERKYVLCKCRADIIDVLRFENAEWYHDPTHVYMYGFVTHWMPLPEPPKEE